MAGLVGITLWIVLATVFPGFVTITVLFGAVVIVSPELLQNGLTIAGIDSEWLWLSVAITIMILTQAIGILLEELLVKMHWLGSRKKKIKCPPGLGMKGNKEFILTPYVEYQGLYILIAKLIESEDSQGHLKRALAQFFLTNNTLVSFFVGIIATLVLSVQQSNGISAGAIIYIFMLLVCLVISYFVAVIRFDVMAKSLWAVRTNKYPESLEIEGDSAE